MKTLLPLIVIFLGLSLKAQPPGCSSTNDVAGNVGQAGLYGEYFAGYHGESPSFFPNTISSTNRIETMLNYTTNNWGAIVPPAGGSVADADNFSSRYRGSIYIATAGVYTFYLTSDDGSYMWIDNAALAYPTVIANALINNGGGHGDIIITNTVNLTAGYHNIQIHYGEGGGGNHLILEYSSTSPSITRQVIPSSVLCTGIQPAIVVPLPTAPPGCTCYAGVTGQYYTGYFADVQTYFTTNTNAINRLDPNIGFNSDGGWGSVCPPLAGSNASPETFSARFSGQIYVPTTTTYTFYLTSDDGSWMWIDANAIVTNPTAGTAFINNGGLHSSATVSSTVSLTAGLHDFKIHFGENTGNNICVLEYASGTITRQTIPQSAFCSCMSTVNLPIELLNFSAEVTSDVLVNLNWQTASETNSKEFELERSKDGVNFNKIGRVDSKSNNGNSVTLLSYSYKDRTPEKNISYYRLKQIDYNGTFKYHSIVAIDLNKKSDIQVRIFPNPNNGNFTLRLKGIKNNQKAEMFIETLDGKLIFDEFVNIENESNDFSFVNFNLNLLPGIYIAKCLVDGVYYPLKIMIN